MHYMHAWWINWLVPCKYQVTCPLLKKFCTQKKRKNLGFCYNSNDRRQSLILYAISVVHLQLSHSFLGQVNHGASEVVHCTCVQRQFRFNSTSHPIYLRYSLSGQQPIGIKDCYCHSNRNLEFYFFYFFLNEVLSSYRLSTRGTVHLPPRCSSLPGYGHPPMFGQRREGVVGKVEFLRLSRSSFWVHLVSWTDKMEHL